MLVVHGQCDEGFGQVADAFRVNFNRGEVGAAVCIYHEGREVVHLWAGVANPSVKPSAPWQEDTCGIIFSATKGLAALAFLMLVDRGLLELDVPVARYWPEFAQGGKDAVTVRTLLNHRSGLIGVPRDLSVRELGDLDLCARVAASIEPVWEPGTDQGYHGVSIGLFTRELFRRITGESMGAFLRREVAEPLQADVWLGLPPEIDARTAPLLPANAWDLVSKVVPAALFRDNADGRVFRNVIAGGDGRQAFRYPSVTSAGNLHHCNDREVRALELPWMGAFATARGLSRVYNALANGGAAPTSVGEVRLVAEATLAPVYERQSWVERDRVLQKPIGWSQGFVKEEAQLFSPNTQSFGHPGAGGFLGWADPVARTSIGYVLNKMSPHVRSPRALALCHALYRSLGASG